MVRIKTVLLFLLVVLVGVPQYVSAGLGAGGHNWWTDFRLFNTPEINLITLTSVSNP